MNKRKKYTPAEKVQIVLEVLREEETLAAIVNQ
jgi:transposase-like protein